MSHPSQLRERQLVVGAHGQVGAAVCSVLGEDAIRAGRQDGSDGTPSVDLAAIAANPAAAQDLIASITPSAIYCIGGATDVERCESDTAWAMDTNCHGPVALAAAARDLPFIYFSTEYVFDGCNGPYRETDHPRALSVYGRSKLEAERRILDVHPDALILRTTVVYGPDRQSKNFLYGLRRILGAGQQMRVPVDQISTPTYNVDLAKATVELTCSGASGIFHVCGPELLSRYEFALQAARIWGLDPDLICPVTTAELNQRAPRPLKAGLLTDKLRSASLQTHMRSTADAIADWLQRVSI